MEDLIVNEAEVLTEQPEQVEEVPSAGEIAEERKIVESNKEANMRMLRERAERSEFELAEMRRSIALQRQQAAAQSQPEEIQINPNDLPEWHQVTKYYDQKNKSNAEDLKKTRVELAQMRAEQQLKSMHPDLDDVVTVKNINALRERMPSIAAIIDRIPDDQIYDKAAAAYDAIKGLGISVSPEYNANKEQIQKNMAKPKPAVSVSVSPLDNASLFTGPLTDERKKAIYAEVQKIKMKGFSGR